MTRKRAAKTGGSVARPRVKHAAAGQRIIIDGPSPTGKVALVMDARLYGEQVWLTAEEANKLWKLGFEWKLGNRSLSDVLKTFFKDASDLPLPKEIQEYRLGSIHAEIVPALKALSAGVAGLDIVVVGGDAPSWGFVHDEPITIPMSGLTSTLLGDALTLSNLRIGSVGRADAAKRKELVALLPQTGLLFGDNDAPSEGFVAGVRIEGGKVPAIELPPGKPAKTGVPASRGGGAGPVDAGKGGAGAAPVDDSDGMRKWFEVGKTIGPLRIARIGCEWKNGKIGLVLDAGIDAAGLHLGLRGLAIRLPPSKPSPANLEVGLDGIDVAYKSAALTIAGALFKREVGRVTDYQGLVLISAGTFALTAMGAYASVDGNPSLYIFAILHMELGGVPAFRVNGLAAGLGYNRSLKIPPIEEVESFPLVRGALDKDYFGGGGDVIGTAMYKLSNYVRPSIGEYWFSIGIRFNSFQLLESVALLSVSFGNDLSISILGLSRLAVPSNLGPNVPHLCYAEIALRAEFKPSAGVLSVEARLTSSSYIFDKSCKLTGGAAFFAWFKGDLSGDFVVTVGGYHPLFVRPPHYPLVPRCGIDWILPGGTVHVTGELYFALTPSCLMAGGRLSAVFDIGWVRAWFIAYVDFFIAWKPFSYDIAIGIHIGVSVTVDLFFFSVSLTVEIGADLHVWGPPFAGTARVSFYVVSFTIAFGNQDKAKPPPLKWEEFSHSFLPSDDSVLSIGFSSGLLAQAQGAEAVVNGLQLGLSIQSQAPCTAIDWNEKAVDGGAAYGTRLGVRPMAVKGLQSKMVVSLAHDASLVPAVFDVSVAKKGFPDALWGQDDRSLTDSSGSILKNTPAGLTVTLSEAGKQFGLCNSLLAMKLEVFEYERIPKWIPWPRVATPEDIKGQGTPSDTIWGNAVVNKRRDAILAVLTDVMGTYASEEVRLPETKAKASSIFQATPTFAALGQLPPKKPRKAQQ
jgi:hypothetical protein